MFTRGADSKQHDWIVESLSVGFPDAALGTPRHDSLSG